MIITAVPINLEPPTLKSWTFLEASPDYVFPNLVVQNHRSPLFYHLVRRFWAHEDEEKVTRFIRAPVIISNVE